MDSVESAIAAEAAGADRLELCTALDHDGLTPASALIDSVQQMVHIPIKVMIRPRAGNFVYSEAEFSQLLESIQICRAKGIREIVTGILLPDLTLDIPRLDTLARAAHPMKITIHKCIDLVPDVFSAIQSLKLITGVHAILSSGQAPTAWEGRQVLKQMLYACADHLTLIVAGKVTQENLARLAGEIGAVEYHGSKIVGTPQEP